VMNCSATCLSREEGVDNLLTRARRHHNRGHIFGADLRMALEVDVYANIHAGAIWKPNDRIVENIYRAKLRQLPQSLIDGPESIFTQVDTHQVLEFEHFFRNMREALAGKVEAGCPVRLGSVQ